LVTSGGRVFWEALGMVAFAVGLAEWLTGPLRVALNFWSVHLSTLVIESLIIVFSTIFAEYIGALGLLSANQNAPGT
jgi:hypothetical protein